MLCSIRDFRPIAERVETHGPLLSSCGRPLQYWKMPEEGSLVSAPYEFACHHQTICFGKVEVNVFRFYLFLLATIPQCIK